MDNERSHAWRYVALAAVVVTTGLWVLGLVVATLDHHTASAVAGIGSVGFAVVGTLVVWQRPENRLGWVFCAGAVTLGVLGTGGEYARRALVVAPGSLPAGLPVAWLADLMAIPTVGLFALVLPLLFPSGRLLSPRWRFALWAAWTYIVLAALGNGFAPQNLESVHGRANPYAVPSARPVIGVFVTVAALCGLVALVSAVVTLVLRWRTSSGEQRAQLKWFLAGVALLPVPLLLHDAVNSASDAALSLLFVLIPATMGVAILRHRLYDLDVVVRRTLVYAALTAVVSATYLAIVGLAVVASGGQVPIVVHVVAAVAAAAAFQPVRARLQHAVDRVFFGDRSRPYDVLQRLARTLENTLVPETVLPAVVETVAEALRVPYVAIELREGGGWVLTAEHGQPDAEPARFPMTYQADVVGRMLVGARAANEPLGDEDLRLLTDVARQAGLAAHAVRATAALQRSRVELVAAREEERRRLRRDLHDGLGPTLAGVSLGLHAARTRTRDDPDEAERLLDALEHQVQDAVADIRRLVYGLRPPTLDEFGLVRAVQLHASRMEGTPDGLVVRVEGPPQGLGRLPAAVEVAAYRIVMEALTNVARHASARACTVRFSLNGALELDVADDGRGLPPDAPAGVGITAMRERAAELGGTLRIDSGTAGTRIVARLPTWEHT